MHIHKMLVIWGALMGAATLYADTETVNGYSWVYTINGETAELSYNYPQPSGIVIVPSTLGGKPVTRICEEAFGNCSGLREIVIPDSVASIGYGAFAGCTNLVKMTIGGGLETIPQYDSIFGGFEYVFTDENGEEAVGYTQGSASLQEVEVGTPAGLAVFENGNFPALRSLVLNYDYTTLPTFLGRLPSLETFDIPYGVTEIPDYAFAGCSGLREIVIPDSVASIGYGAFAGCTNLVKMTIGGGLETIPQYDSIFGGFEYVFTDENGEEAVGYTQGSASLQEVEVGTPAGLAVFATGSFPKVTKVVFGWRFIDLPQDYLEYFPNATGATVEEALPDLNGTSDEKVAMILNNAFDAGLTNVTDIATYNTLRSWAIGNRQQEDSQNAAMARILTSQFSWSAFALDAPELLTRETPIQNDDVKISSFTSNGEQGSFSMEVAIEDVVIGDAADAARLAMVFGIEGANSLTENSFASENVIVEMTEPMNGKVHLVVKPNVDANAGADSFFMRVRVSQ